MRESRRSIYSSRTGLLGLLLALAGCAASGEHFAPVAPNAGESIIYVYTLDDEYPLSQAPKVTIDSREMGRLRPRGYLRVPVAPGPHKVNVTGSLIMLPIHKTEVALDVKAGEQYYVRMDGFRGYKLERMPADLAQDELKATRGNN